jgi:hypothetical protein
MVIVAGHISADLLAAAAAVDEILKRRFSGSLVRSKGDRHG